MLVIKLLLELLNIYKYKIHDKNNKMGNKTLNIIKFGIDY